MLMVPYISFLKPDGGQNGHGESNYPVLLAGEDDTDDEDENSPLEAVPPSMKKKPRVLKTAGTPSLSHLIPPRPARARRSATAGLEVLNRISDSLDPSVQSSRASEQAMASLRTRTSLPCRAKCVIYAQRSRCFDRGLPPRSSASTKLNIVQIVSNSKNSWLG